ncbi:hypothetical protein B4135_2374 [Caldibacillus debilis]|uniref:Uncharacterized protein n=1 Tax=Caldibacillus debilis TaxID=301148 RepID=A0A150LZN9_9BACI|nr:hypothetical protein B4135_2374 [Caldibacillus debilis]
MEKEKIRRGAAGSLRFENIPGGARRPSREEKSRKRGRWTRGKDDRGTMGGLPGKNRAPIGRRFAGGSNAPEKGRRICSHP